MEKIVVIKVSNLGNLVTIGLFGRDGGESRMTFTLSGKLFPADIKQGDEVIFQKRAPVLSIAQQK